MEYLLFFSIGVSFYMAWGIGANDVANSMGDAVGSGAISVGKAMVLACICEFCGAVFVGANVTETLRGTIIDTGELVKVYSYQEELMVLFIIGMVGSLLASGVVLHICSSLGMPVSTTHSIVGSIAGFGIAAGGIKVIYWDKMGKIFLSWILSPLFGCIGALVLFKVILVTILRREYPAKSAYVIMPYIIFITVFIMSMVLFTKCLTNLKSRVFIIDVLTEGYNPYLVSTVSGILIAMVFKKYIKERIRNIGKESLSYQIQEIEKIFAPIVVSTSCCVAFSHGANDVANAVGPLAGVVTVLSTRNLSMNVPVPLWVLVVGGLGMVVGLLTYGYRVMRTIGKRITQLTPSRGVAADIATSAIVLIASGLKLPISTTHTIVGAIFGVGLAKGWSGIDSRIAREILLTWFVNVPIAAIISILFFLAGKVLFFNLLLEILKR